MVLIRTLPWESKDTRYSIRTARGSTHSLGHSLFPNVLLDFFIKIIKKNIRIKHRFRPRNFFRADWYQNVSVHLMSSRLYTGLVERLVAGTVAQILQIQATKYLFAVAWEVCHFIRERVRSTWGRILIPIVIIY